jgi:hypothetical protein
MYARSRLKSVVAKNGACPTWPPIHLQAVAAAAAAAAAVCSPNDNAYAHPLDLLPLVDLNLKKVIRIDKHSIPPKVRGLLNTF